MRTVDFAAVCRHILAVAAATAAILLSGCATAPTPRPSGTAGAHTPAAPETDPVPERAGAAVRSPEAGLPQAAHRPPVEALPAATPDLRIVPGTDGILIGDREHEQLEAIARRVKGKPGLSLTIESYSSWHGSRELNMAMAQQRAEEIREALSALGVPPSRILATAYGEERKNRSHAERSRIDIHIVDATRQEIRLSPPAPGSLPNQ